MIFGTDPFGTAFNLPAVTIVELWYEADTILALTGTLEDRHKMDLLLCATPIFKHKMSARIGVPTPSYQMDIIIVTDESDPRLFEGYINTFMWSYADELQKVDQTIQLMVQRLKLDYADTGDLDEYWGPILNIRRRPLESNDTYRARLATHIRVITSNGVKANIQAIIDRIIGHPGGSIVESFYPSEVRLSWSNPTVIASARSKSDLISDAMNRALAAGVTWYTAYPLAHYQMDMMKAYLELASYQADAAISKRKGLNYYMRTGFWESGGADYDMDSVLYSFQAVTYQAMARLIAEHFSGYEMGVEIIVMQPHYRVTTYQADGAISMTRRKYYEMSVMIE